MNINLKWNKFSKLTSKPKFLSITFLSLLGTITIIISYIESYFSLLFALPPGIKPGLANVVTMFICSCFGLMPAIIVVIIKAFFIALTKGIIAFLMSILGGILSTLAVGILINFKTKLNYVFISIIGAIIHNMTQISIASAIIGKVAFYYTPILILFSIFAGILTGTILKTILPVLTKKLRS